MLKNSFFHSLEWVFSSTYSFIFPLSYFLTWGPITTTAISKVQTSTDTVAEDLKKNKSQKNQAFFYWIQKTLASALALNNEDDFSGVMGREL